MSAHEPVYSTKVLTTNLSEQDGTHYVRFGNTFLPISLFDKVMKDEEVHHWEYTDYAANIRYIVWND